MEQQYYEIASNFTPVFNIALALLKGRGCEEICYTISSAKISVVNTEYDNWNGGTYGYTVYISLSVKLYTSFSAEQISHMEKVISELLLSDKTLARAHTCIRPQKKGKKLCPFPRIL